MELGRGGGGCELVLRCSAPPLRRYDSPSAHASCCPFTFLFPFLLPNTCEKKSTGVNVPKKTLVRSLVGGGALAGDRGLRTNSDASGSQARGKLALQPGSLLQGPVTTSFNSPLPNLSSYFSLLPQGFPLKVIPPSSVSSPLLGWRRLPGTGL